MHGYKWPMICIRRTRIYTQEKLQGVRARLAQLQAQMESGELSMGGWLKHVQVIGNARI